MKYFEKQSGLIDKGTKYLKNLKSGAKEVKNIAKDLSGATSGIVKTKDGGAIGNSKTIMARQRLSALHKNNKQFTYTAGAAGVAGVGGTGYALS